MMANITGQDLSRMASESDSWDYCRMHYDSVTGERGPQLKIQISENVVKGELLHPSATTDMKYSKQTVEYDVTSVAYEAGSADDYIWTWTTGAMCQMLVKDSTAMVRGYVAIAADTDGRASNIDLGTIGGNPSIDTHFKEVGHVLESKDAGTDVICMIHFHTL